LAEKIVFICLLIFIGCGEIQYCLKMAFDKSGKTLFWWEFILYKLFQFYML